MKSGLFLRFFVIFLLVILFLYADNFHVVDPGPCDNRDKYYCQEKIKNSYCSRIKNKCFCLPNFVAIKEKENNIICKSLLTNLKCGMDKDCTDVKNSICHPEASQCSCPAQTFYVKENHACEIEAKPYYDRRCIKCLDIGGRCYNDISSTLQRKRNFCSCPGITLFNDNGLENEENLIQCFRVLVDIGHYCNNDTRICKSRNSICYTNLLTGYGICQCIRNFAPLYQKNLGYHECYSEQKDSGQKNCKSCINIDGTCINMNENPSGDACKCPLSGRVLVYDHEMRDSPQEMFIQKCRNTNDIVQITCSFHQIKVCFKIEQSEFPTLFAQTFINQSTIFFSDRILSHVQSVSHSISLEIDPRCVFSQLEIISNSKIEVCQTVLFEKRIKRFPCGIEAIHYMNGFFYSGYVEIWKNRYIPDLLKDKLFDISCKSTNTEVSEIVGQAIERSWPTSSFQLISREYHNDLSFLSFSAVDINNKISDSFAKFTPIRLQGKLNANATSYKHISAEQCWVQNSSHIIPGQTDSLKLISKGCSFKESGFTTNFLSVYDSPILTSALFPIFQLSESEKIYFRCLFRLCKNPQWCKLSTNCMAGEERDYSLDPVPLDSQDIIYVAKAFSLSVLHNKILKSDSNANTNKVSDRLDCNYFWCVTKIKLAIMLIAFCGILLLASGIFVLLCYRQKMISEMRQCNQLSIQPSSSLNTPKERYCPDSNFCLTPKDQDSYMLIPINNRVHYCHPSLLECIDSSHLISSTHISLPRKPSLTEESFGSYQSSSFSKVIHPEIITISNSGENVTTVTSPRI